MEHLEFAKLNVGWTSFYLPRQDALKVVELLSHAVQGESISYHLGELDPALANQAVAKNPGRSDGRISLELVSAMPLPYFDQDARLAELRAARDAAAKPAADHALKVV